MESETAGNLRIFPIEDTYVGYETIQMGNVNKTYKVNFLLSDGSSKSFLVQNVNTYAFRDPVGLMENIDGVTEHIRSKYPGHNLVRTRCQIALAKDMLKKMDEMNAIVRSCVDAAK